MMSPVLQPQIQSGLGSDMTLWACLDINGWQKKGKKKMRISRTNTPTLGSVIISLEKGKKTEHLTITDNQRFKPCQVPLSPLYSHFSPSALHPLWMCHYAHPALAFSPHVRCLFLEIRSLSAERLWWEADGHGPCARQIRCKVHVDLQWATLLYALVFLL